MSLLLFIIIFALLLEYVLERVAGILNIKKQHGGVPSDFEQYYDQNKYKDSQEYLRVNTNFTHLTATVNLLIILGMIVCGAFNTLDIIIRDYNLSSLLSGLIFWGGLFIILDVLQMPFSLYQNFSIEERFGFNNMSIKTYIVDKIKSYFLLTLIGGFVLYLILYFFQYFGDQAWIYTWLFLSIFIILIQPLFTLFVAPFFNTFTPLEEGSLKNKISDFLISVNFPITKIDVMDGSKRSSKSNAYFSGLGKNKRIALFDNLINNHSENELVSIIAHEVGHYKKNHIIKNILFSVIHIGVLLFCLSFFINNKLLFEAFKMENLSIYASILFFFILYSPIEFLLSILFNYISRKFEFEADAFAAKAVGSPKHLIAGLKKLSISNLSNLNPHPLTVFLYYSHPPVIDRVRNLEK